MKLSYIWRTSIYRGDHTSDVSIAIEHFDSETLVEFAERILGNGDKNCGDVLEIRRIEEAK